MKETDFSQSQTLTNLARAFAGECQANIRIKMISKKALDEGYFELSKLLYAVAKHDCIHATLFYDAITQNLGNSQNNVEITAGYPFKSGTILQNLKNCYENQLSEGSVIYPQFATIAKDEGFLPIVALFEQVASVELEHAKLLNTLYEKTKSNQLYKSGEEQKWVCGVCGYIKQAKSALKTCPLCGADRHQFILTFEGQQKN